MQNITVFTQFLCFHENKFEDIHGSEKVRGPVVGNTKAKEPWGIHSAACI